MNKGRKITGGKYHKNRKKKHHEKDTQETIVLLGDRKARKWRGRGGNHRVMMLRGNIANVKVGDKVQKAEIKNVVETPQNVFLARQNRILKSAIVETSLGKARITNRPVREGHINAVLIEGKEIS